MLELSLVLFGITIGVATGIGFMLLLMGPALRDQFFGRNLENKPIVIDWIDGRERDVHIKMRNVVIFVGNIMNISLSGGFRPGPTQVHLELVSKLETLRAAKH